MSQRSTLRTTDAPPFNRLVELHYRPLFRFAAALCGRPETALALTQRTLQRARQRRAASATTSTRTWLFTLLFLEFLAQRPRPHPRCGDEHAGFSA
jgi:RNA polymerase sigma-70 factor (ECF subfamily)